MNFLNTIQIIAAFNFLFIGTLILLSSKRMAYGVRLLSVFLLAKGLTLTTNLVYEMQWPINSSLVQIASSALFLYAPFLYFFARHLVYKKKVALGKDFVHFAPFLLYLVFNVVNLFYPFENVVTFFIITIFYYLQTIGYTIASFQLIRRKGDGSVQQSWIKYLLLSFVVVWSMFLAETVSSLLGDYGISQVFKTLGVLSLFILANLTLVMAIYSPEIFFKGFRLIKTGSAANKLVNRDNYDRLLSIMATRELYKNPQFKLGDLSRELEISERNTSLLIKEYHNGNFYDFLNSYRIEEAKRLFIEKQDSLTITEVLYDVGFNSKSVFNTLFKKKVGMTPSQFKKSNSKMSTAG